MKAFDQLDNPIVLRLPVRKHLNLLGNHDWGYEKETVGNVFVVYDTTTDSLHDWAFFEGRKARLDWGLANSCAGGKYYTSIFSDGRTKNYRVAFLDKTTGTIKEVNKYPYWSPWITENHLIAYDYNHRDDDSFDYIFNTVDLNNFEEKEIKLVSDAYISIDTINEKMYVEQTFGNEKHISRLSADGSKFDEIFYFTFQGKKFFDIINVFDNYLVLLCTDNLENDNSEKYYYIFDLNNLNADGPTEAKGIFYIPDYSYRIEVFIYNEEVYLLYVNQSNDYLETNSELFKASFADTHFVKIADYPKNDFHTIYDTRLIGSKFYLFTNYYEEANISFSYEGACVNYIDLESLELTERKAFFYLEKLLKESK
jgi:hypothetical protein